MLKVLRDQKIDYIIAPYEADAQLAYLSKSGIADLVLTEDSDLIVFGCSKVSINKHYNYCNIKCFCLMLSILPFLLDIFQNVIERRWDSLRAIQTK